MSGSVSAANGAGASARASEMVVHSSDFGWPLVCAGVLKGVYDLLLFAQFAQRRPAEAT